jgi:glycosyltransferase involved in cell wall biosynthesis
MNKKILLINNGYPSKEMPNFTSWMVSIEKCLKNAGFDVDLLVIKFKNSKIFTKIKQYLHYAIRLLTTNLSYDIIYINHPTFSFPVFCRPKLKYKKVFLHWHGEDLICKTKLNKKILLFFRKKYSSYYHITPSFYFKRELIKRLSIPEKKIFVSPSGGVDISIFSKFEKHKTESKLVIGYCSALNASKGADIILEMARKSKFLETRLNKPIEFAVINYGNDESQYYIERILNEKLPICIWKTMKKQNMPNFYNSIDLLLMPSIREGESLGLVVLEAMSCNVPVITYDICAFPEFVINEISGERLVFTDSFDLNLTKFMDLTIHVLSNVNLYNPRKIVVDNYSEEAVINEYKKIFAEIK